MSLPEVSLCEGLPPTAQGRGIVEMHVSPFHGEAGGVHCSPVECDHIDACLTKMDTEPAATGGAEDSVEPVEKPSEENGIRLVGECDRVGCVRIDFP